MASVKGVNRTIIDLGDGTKIPAQELGGVKFFEDLYEASALASGSDIKIGKTFKAGEKIIDIVLWNDALGGSSTLKVGDAGDDDRFIVAAASSAAGRRDLNVIAGQGYEFTGDTDILITTGGANITGTIKVLVLYK